MDAGLGFDPGTFYLLTNTAKISALLSKCRILLHLDTLLKSGTKYRCGSGGFS